MAFSDACPSYCAPSAVSPNVTSHAPVIYEYLEPESLPRQRVVVSRHYPPVSYHSGIGGYSLPESDEAPTRKYDQKYSNAFQWSRLDFADIVKQNEDDRSKEGVSIWNAVELSKTNNGNPWELYLEMVEAKSLRKMNSDHATEIVDDLSSTGSQDENGLPPCAILESQKGESGVNVPHEGTGETGKPLLHRTGGESMANDQLESREMEEKTHRSKQTSSPGPLEMLYEGIFPATPVIGRRDSAFLAAYNGSLRLQDASYCTAEDDKAYVPCTLELNESHCTSYNMETHLKPLMYYGFIYPDETSISYLPIRRVKVLYKEVRGEHRNALNRSNTGYGKTYVEIVLKRPIFEAIIQAAHAAAISKNPSAYFIERRPKYYDDGVGVDVLIKKSDCVKVSNRGNVVFGRIQDILEFCKADIDGDAFFHMRVSVGGEDQNELDLRFLLYGLRVSRNKANGGQRVFKFNSKKPIFR